MWVQSIPALAPYAQNFISKAINVIPSSLFAYLSWSFVYVSQGERLTSLTNEELRDFLDVVPLGPRKVFFKELSYLLNDSK